MPFYLQILLCRQKFWPCQSRTLLLTLLDRAATLHIGSDSETDTDMPEIFPKIPASIRPSSTVVIVMYLLAGLKRHGDSHGWLLKLLPHFAPLRQRLRFLMDIANTLVDLTWKALLRPRRGAKLVDALLCASTSRTWVSWTR